MNSKKTLSDAKDWHNNFAYVGALEALHVTTTYNCIDFKSDRNYLFELHDNLIR